MKAHISTFLHGVPLTAYLVLGLGAGTAGWLTLNNRAQREQGALEVQLQMVQAAADSATAVLTQRNAGLDALVASFSATVARNAAAKHAADVQSSRLRSARDSLAQAVADSLATIEELRARAARMIAASDSAERAHQIERVTSDSSLKAAKRTMTFAVDSVRAAGQQALDLMRTRAETAERIDRTRSKGLRAALLGRCGAIGGYGGVWHDNKLLGGPTVTLGCRAFP